MIDIQSYRRIEDRCSIAIALFCIIGCSSAANATASISECVNNSAARFGISPQLLVAVGHVESSWRCDVVSRPNANGTIDIGCMQINSSWLPLLSKKFGITKEQLFDPCTNIHVGAWLLAKNRQTYGDTWRAIGAYNAASESKRMTYAWKIKSKLSAS